MITIKNIHRNQRKKFLLLLLLIVIYVVYLLFSVTILIGWFIDSKKTKDISEKIEKSIVVEEVVGTKEEELVNPPVTQESDYWYYTKQKLMSVDFRKLKKINNDTIGWIQLQGTNINYPIVQTTDNSYYLSHSYNKENNTAGWVFMDYRNNATNLNNNTIIYAHSRNDGSMFGSLKTVLTKEWLNNKQYHTVYFSTPYENTLWQVFSVYTTPSESYYITPTFKNKEDYTKFLITLKKRSIYNFPAELNVNDKILTLSTCRDNYGNRIVLHAKLIKKNMRTQKEGI